MHTYDKTGGADVSALTSVITIIGLVNKPAIKNYHPGQMLSFSFTLAYPNECSLGSLRKFLRKFCYFEQSVYHITGRVTSLACVVIIAKFVLMVTIRVAC